MRARRRVPPALRLLAGAVLPMLPVAEAVTFEPVPASARWRDAAEPGALRLACASGEDALAAHFAREGLSFRVDLVRRQEGRVCHLFYRPTVPGFRASPDDDRVSRVVFDSDPVLYLASGERNRGDATGAMAEVLRRVPRPLDVSVLLHRVHDPAAYERATARLFGGTPHRVTLEDRGVPRTFWWVQDTMKAGASSRGPAVLVPRRVFEGGDGTADGFDPLLAQLADRKGFVRSRLSWEGGDLQLTRDPRDPSRLLLVYGAAAKPYWGEYLSPAEYEYVLALELGADAAVDLGGIAPHVDYFVSFLPGAATALVATPVSGDLAVARAAVDALLARMGGPGPAPLAELRERLSSPLQDPSRAREALARARREQGGWSLAVDPTLPDRMRALVGRGCPGGGDCLSPSNQLKLLDADPVTFGDWVHATQSARDEPSLIAAHLDLVESQLEPVPESVRRLVRERVRALEAAGFRIVGVPAFRVGLGGGLRRWPGISYVNALVLEGQVFVPRFGLGAAEERLFRGTAAHLPAGYTLVPIDAQQVLVRGGGLHCLAGLVR